MLSLVLTAVIAAHAEIPHLISFQGKATDIAGNPLNGTYDLTFRLYNHQTAGDLKWSETHSATQITNGVFQVLLGNNIPIDLAFDEDYWISVQVNTDSEMMPRSQFSSVGYAYKAIISDYAARAEVAEKVDTVELIEAKGGLVIEEPHEISSGSWICLFNDPSGATFAMIQQERSSPDEKEGEKPQNE